MVAIAVRVPAIALEREEAEKLDGAIKRVWKHYPLNVSQKQMDIAFACTVAAEIYGTRIVAAVVSKSAEPQPIAQAPDLSGVAFINPGLRGA
jgi:hypothetical protein